MLTLGTQAIWGVLASENAVPVTAVVTYNDGHALQLENLSIHYEFGESSSDPKGITLYSPTHVRSGTLHLINTRDGVKKTHAFDLKDGKRIVCAYDTENDDHVDLARNTTIELVSGETLTGEFAINCKALTKQRFVFSDSARLEGRTKAGGDFKLDSYLFFAKYEHFRLRPHSIERLKGESDASYDRRMRQAKKDVLKAKAAEVVKEISFQRAVRK